ncbi:MAG TPA: zinc-dependent metalloprotease, partial [Acidimicrobiales bacterium]
MPAPALVDWGLAERIGIRVASRSAALDADLPALQRDMEAQAGLAESLVTQVTGLVPAGPAEIRVVDRPAWVRANIVSFQRLLAPLVERWDERTASRSGVGAELTSRVAAAELGTLLGWMSSRVLGQYDLLLAGQAEATDDAPASDDGPAPADGGHPAEGRNPAEGDVVYLVGP